MSYQIYLKPNYLGCTMYIVFHPLFQKTRDKLKLNLTNNRFILFSFFQLIKVVSLLESFMDHSLSLPQLKPVCMAFGLYTQVLIFQAVLSGNFNCLAY